MSATFLIDIANAGITGYSIVPGTTISSDTTTSGTAVDCLLMEGPIHGFFCTGNAGDGSTTIQFKLQECDTSGGSYTDISDGVNSAVTAGGGSPSVPVTAFVLGRRKISGPSYDGSKTNFT